MDVGLVIPSAVALIAVGLYVLALWIGDHRTISTLAGASNFAFALAVVLIGLACALGVSMSSALAMGPDRWIEVAGHALRSL